ncbi:MAG TPA: hypothetical protein VGP55_10885 [Chitinophagaceae bacterium]|nr:hypothetical protein [Chitinophagaceae bacterium]
MDNKINKSVLKFVYNDYAIRVKNMQQVATKYDIEYLQKARKIIDKNPALHYPIEILKEISGSLGYKIFPCIENV